MSRPVPPIVDEAFHLLGATRLPGRARFVARHQDR